MTQELRQLQEALAQNPNDVGAFSALYQHHSQASDWRELVDLFDKHPPAPDQAGPGFSELASRLGEIEKSLSNKQERGQLLVALGDLYIHQLDRREDAMTAYQKSFKTWPKDTTCLERARSIYIEAGDFERVIVLYELQSKVLKKMQMASELAVTYTEMAEVFGEQLKNPVRALELVLDARDVDPGVETVAPLYERYRVSEVLSARINEFVAQAEDSGNSREAARLMTRAARLERARSAGELEIARAYVQRALQHDAKSKAAATLLDEIEQQIAQPPAPEPASEPSEVEDDFEVGATQVLRPEDFERREAEVSRPRDEEGAEAPAQDEDAQITVEQELEDAGAYDLEEVADEPAAEEPATEEEQVEEAGADSEPSEVLTRELPEETLEPGESDYVLEELADAPETLLGEPEARDEEPTREAEVELTEALEDDATEEAVEEDAVELEEVVEPAPAEEAAAQVEEGEEAVELEEVVEQEVVEPAAVEEDVLEPEDAVAEEDVTEEEELELEEVVEDGGGEEAAVELEEITPQAAAGSWSLDLDSIVAPSDDELATARAALKKDAADRGALAVVKRALLGELDLDGYVKQMERSVKYLRKKDGEFDEMFELAMVLWKEQENIDRAEYYFKRLRHHDAEMREVLDFYEIFFAEKQQWRKLHVHLNGMLQAAEDDSSRRRYTRRMAEVAEQHMNSPEKAIDAWRGFLREHPEDVEARDELRRLYEEHQKWQALVEYLRDEQQRLGDDEASLPDRVALLEEISDIYRDRITGGDINRINSLNQLLELDPSHSRAFGELKELLEGNRRYGELASLLSTQADAASEAGDIARAIELLTEVADLYQVRLNNMTQALPFLTKVLELDHTHKPTRERLKEVYNKRRDYPSLFELLEQETGDKHGDELEAHLRELLGLAQERLRKPELAVPILVQLIELAQDDVELYNKLEFIYRRQESWEELAALLEQKATLDGLADSDVVAAYKEAAQLCDVKLEDPERAATLWRHVLTLDEGNATAFARLRDIYIEHRRFDDLFDLFAERDGLERYYDVLSGVADQTEDVEERCAILRRMAELAEKQLVDDQRVVASLERLLENTSDRPQVARELIGWYRQVGRLDAEIQMHELLLEHSDDAIDQFAELVRLAELEIERTQDEAALNWQLRAVATIPSEEDAVQKAEDLARHVGMLEVFLDHIESIADTREEGSTLQKQLLHRVARLARDEVEDNARSIDVFERLKGLEPANLEWLRALEHLYDLAAYPSKRIGVLEEVIRVLEEEGAAESQIVDQYYKIATVQHRQIAETEAATGTYLTILDVDADYVPALRGLREIYGVDGQWDSVVEMLEREFELTPLDETEGRVALQMELARIWRDFKESPADALGYYAQVLNAYPDHVDALEMVEGLLPVEEVARDGALLIEPILRQTAQHERLAGALEARFAVCQDDFEQQEILEELVPLYDETLEDLERAFPHACRRFELDASNEQRWHDLERFAGTLERWEEVEGLFSAWAPFTPEGEEEHGGRVELLRHIATAREEHLADKQGALEAWERLYHFEPEDLSVIAPIERLYRELTMHRELVGILDAKSDVVLDPAERVTLLLEAANLTDELLEEVSDAIILHQRVLEIDQTQVDAVSALERLLRQEERFEDLDELFESQANLSSDPARRRDFLLQQGALRTHQLADAQGAFGILRELIQEDAEDPRAVAQLVELDQVVAAEDLAAPLRLDIALDLEQLYRAREDFPKLIEILEVRLGFTEEAFERIALLDELAALYLSRVGDQQSSFERTREAVILMPDDLERRERFERLGDKLDALGEVVDAYKLATLEVDDFVAAPLHKRAGEILKDRLGLAEQAIESYEQALEVNETDADTLGALEQLYEQTEKWPEYTDNLRAQAEFADPERRATLLRRVGLVEESILDRAPESIDAWAELLNMEPEASDAIESLERLYERQEQWVDLSEVLRRKAGLCGEDEAAQIAVLHKLALVFEQRLEDETEAIMTYQQILSIEPAHNDALDALDDLFVREERWADLSEILRAKLELDVYNSEDELRTVLELRRAKILADELMSIDEALDLYLAVFSRHPGQPEAREALERFVDDAAFAERCAPALIAFYEEEGLWTELVGLYDTLSDQAHDPELQADYSHKQATIHRDRLEDYPSAMDAMSQAWTLSPGRDDWRQELIALAEIQEAWGPLAQVYEDVLLEVSEPEKLKVLRVELAEVYRDKLDNATDAEMQFQEALNFDERDLSIYEALEAMLAEQERWTDLVDLLERRYNVFAAEPESKELLLRMANIHDEFADDGYTAVDTYRRVIDVDAMDASAPAAINRLMRAQERWPDLADFLEERVALFADDDQKTIALKTELAELYSEKMLEPERALELWVQILDIEAHHEPTIASLEALFEADENMRQMVAQNLEPIYKERGQWTEYIHVLRTKAESSYDDYERVELLRQIAQTCKVELRDWPQALETYGELFGLVPRELDIRTELAGAAERINAWPRVVEIYEDTLDNNFDIDDVLRAELLFELGLIFEERLVSLDDARDTFAKILETDPVNEQAFDGLERVNVRMEDWLALSELYEQRADSQLDPSVGMQWLDRLATLKEEVIGDRDEALDVYQKMFELDPTDMPTQRAMERLLRELGRFDDLSDLYRRLLFSSNEPEHITSMHFKLAQLLEIELNEIDEAIELYRTILQMQRGHRDSLRALEALRRDLQGRDGDWDINLMQVTELLLENYDAEQDWRRIVDLLELRESVSEDPAERVLLLSKAAELVENNADERGDRFQALTLRTRAWCLSPDDDQAFRPLEAIAGQLEAWERVVPQILEGLNVTDEPEEQARLLNAAARVYQDKIQDLDSALIAYEQVLDLHDTNETAMRQLEGLYGQFGHWQPLVRLLEIRLENTYDGDARIVLLQRIAKLHEETLESPVDAISAYESLRELDPSALVYMDKLQRLYQLTERHEDLAEVLSAKAALVTDNEPRFETLQQLAQVQHHVLDDKLSAVETYRQILAIDEDDEGSVRALVDLYQESQSWYELLEMLDVLRSFAGGVAELDAVEFRIAEIYLDYVDQPAQALDSLRSICERSPEHTDALETLDGMLENEMVRDEVFLALEKLHRENQRWGYLETLYKKRIDYLEDPFERTETRMRQAKLQENELESPRKALVTYGDALCEMPTQENIREELERVAGVLGAEDDLIDIYESALEAGVSDPIAETALHARLGDLYIDEREEAAPAISHMEAVLDADEYNIQALDVLDKLYQQEERWDDLADILQRKLSVVEPEQLTQARYRLGYLREVIFEQPIDAYDLYQQVITEQPDHRGVTEALERLSDNEALRADVCDLLEGAYERTETWTKLAELLKFKLEFLVDAPHEKAELLRRVATLQYERLGDAEQSFEFFGQALATDPFDSDTEEKLDKLVVQLDAYARIVDLYDGIVTDLDDPIRQAELAAKAAAWSYNNLDGDLERAHRLYTLVFEIEPQNEDALLALEAIARRQEDDEALTELLAQKVELVSDPTTRFEAFKELGALYTKLDRPDDAINALRDASMIDPSSREICASLVDLYEATDSDVDLVDELERLVQLTPEQPEQLDLLVRIGKEASGRLQDNIRALDALERALAMAPRDIELLRKVEPLYAQTGQMDRQAEILDRQLELAESDDDRVKVMVRRAQIAYEFHGNAEQAIDLFQQAYQISPTSQIITDALDELYRKEERWHDLFNLYYAQLQQATEPDRRASLAVEMSMVANDFLGDSDTGLQYLDYALQVVPSHARSLEIKKTLLTGLERWAEVVDVLTLQFNAATDAEVQCALLLERAELLEQKLERLEDAVDGYVEVLNVDPTHVVAYQSLTTLLNKLDAWEQLYDVMSFRVDHIAEDDRKQMYLDMAVVAEKLGDTARRIDALEAAYKIDPADLDVVRPLLDAAIAAGQFDRAEPMLESVIQTLTEKRRMKDVVGFYHLRGKLAEQRGDSDGALTAFEAARKIDATYVPNLLSLGQAYYNRQDWDAALKIFQTLLLHQMSIKDKRDKVNMYYYLGQVRLQLGDARRAKDMFNRALGVDPNHEPTKAAIASL